MTDDSRFQTLADLSSIPSAPFHEATVARYVADCLRDLGIPLEVDPFGNLIATHRNGATERPIALVAHLDHPAIEVSEILSSSEGRAILLGGVPAAGFDRPVLVSMVTASGTRSATIVGREVNPATGRIASLLIRYSGDLSVGDWG
ncbi:MAG TPA: hypothetical protein VKT80_12415, partial [Chloroflexota bacterium]|nr:hypothetical protein [Chloroflexota bacterium]